MAMSADMKPHSHVPYGPDGSGHFSENSLTCHKIVKLTQDLVQNALEKIPYIPEDGAFTICDYGTADGGTSMVMIADVIKWLKSRYGDTCAVHVVYEDQPVNDFKSLFLRLHGLILGQPTYYKDYENVYVSATGTSFYSQCVPNKFVHLGFSSTAVHWLSKSPCLLDDTIFYLFSKNIDKVAAFVKQAAKDWETILLHRAQELKPGGQMVVSCSCVDPAGYYQGNTPDIRRSAFDEMASCWCEMFDEGRITQEEYSGAQFNVYWRTKEEFMAPFTEGTTVHKTGLRLVDIKFKMVGCPFHAKWVADGDKGDPEARRKHAQWFVPSIRVWSNYSFLSALNALRPEGERTALVDAFYQKYEDRVALAPDRHSSTNVTASIHMAKV